MAKEKRLIYANDAKEALIGWDTDPTDEEIEYTIDKITTVDAVPVVHGRWEKREAVVFDDELVGYRCSECNTTWDAETNYCPNCGADMRDGDGNG